MFAATPKPGALVVHGRLEILTGICPHPYVQNPDIRSHIINGENCREKLTICFRELKAHNGFFSPQYGETAIKLLKAATRFSVRAMH
jgi:hypothetical protein